MGRWEIQDLLGRDPTLIYVPPSGDRVVIPASDVADLILFLQTCPVTWKRDSWTASVSA